MSDIGIEKIDETISLLDKAFGIARAGRKNDRGRFLVGLQALKIREFLREWDALSKTSAIKIDKIFGLRWKYIRHCMKLVRHVSDGRLARLADSRTNLNPPTTK